MKTRSMQLFKGKLLKLWTALLSLIRNICILTTFLMIPVLLGKVIYSVYCDLYLVALVQTIVVVLLVYINKEL